MRVRALQAGVTLEQVRAATGFELLVHDELYSLPPVEDAELAVLRDLVHGERVESEEITR
jgi:glutaconate CoA-transferase subunit B